MAIKGLSDANNVKKSSCAHIEINDKIETSIHNLSQRDESNLFDEGMAIIIAKDLENDKNWEDYFSFVAKEVQNAYNKEGNDLSSSDKNI